MFLYYMQNPYLSSPRKMKTSVEFSRMYWQISKHRSANSLVCLDIHKKLSHQLKINDCWITKFMYILMNELLYSSIDSARIMSIMSRCLHERIFHDDHSSWINFIRGPYIYSIQNKTITKWQWLYFNLIY